MLVFHCEELILIPIKIFLGSPVVIFIHGGNYRTGSATQYGVCSFSQILFIHSVIYTVTQYLIIINSNRDSI